MTIEKLTELINLQDVIKERVFKVYNEIKNDEYANILAKNFTIKELSSKTLEDAKSYFKNDENNDYLLTLNLMAALITYDNYKEKGISDQIFIETMKCITRFIHETYLKTGTYFFDRAWWSYRQLNMTLFRIEELEYEILDDVISIHIPSDAVFTKEKIDESFAAAKAFLNKFYKESSNKKVYCESWLLSPLLRDLLNEKSNIISFQNRFKIYGYNPAPQGFYLWVFNAAPGTKIEDLKEDTSLQRKIKALLKEGKSIGVAEGDLIGEL